MRPLSGPASARRAGRRDRESGSTAVEFVLWTPLLMFILIALVQLGIYVFAQHVAATAAQAGARAARQDEPSDAQWKKAAELAADSWVQSLVGSAAGSPVTVDSSLTKGVRKGTLCPVPTVTVVVSFDMNSLFGGFQAHGESEGPVENFYLDNC